MSELRHFRFVSEIASDDIVIMRFRDPSVSYVVRVDEPVQGEAGLDVFVTANHEPPMVHEASAASVFVKYRGVELAWRPGRAAFQCDPDQVEALVAGVIEFAHYERELRQIEESIAHGWTDLERDKSLAFEVTAAGLKQSEIVGHRMKHAFGWRICLARMEPRLFAPEAGLPAAARKLGEELRERADIEARVEAVDGQLEVFEHIYEMAGQRMGEFRAARESNILEWVIVVLLLAEALLMLLQVIFRTRG